MMDLATSPTGTAIEFEYFTELFSWLLRVRDKIAPIDPPYAQALSKSQLAEAMAHFTAIAPKGYANEQVKAAMEHIHANCRYDPTRGLASRITEAIAELRPQPVYSLNGEVGRLPPAREALPEATDLKKLLTGALSGTVDPEAGDPNPPLAEVAMTYWDFSVVREEDRDPPDAKFPNNGLHGAINCRIMLAARNVFKGRFGDQWHQVLATEQQTKGHFDDLFGDRKVFSHRTPWNPKAKAIPIATDRDPAAAMPQGDALEGRLL